MDFKVAKVDTDLWEDYKGRKLEANHDKEELLCDLRVHDSAPSALTCDNVSAKRVCYL